MRGKLKETSWIKPEKFKWYKYKSFVLPYRIFEYRGGKKIHSFVLHSYRPPTWIFTTIYDYELKETDEKPNESQMQALIKFILKLYENT
jgi:hypothetical protein